MYITYYGTTYLEELMITMTLSQLIKYTSHYDTRAYFFLHLKLGLLKWNLVHTNGLLCWQTDQKFVNKILIKLSNIFSSIVTWM